MTEETSRNVKVLQMDLPHLFDFFRGGRFEVMSGLPSGAVFDPPTFNNRTGCFEFLVEHPDFEPICEGQILPYFHSNIIRMKKKDFSGVSMS